MARQRKSKSNTTTGVENSSTGTPLQRRGRPPLDPINWQTPKGPTPDKRDHHAKSKVVAVIGQLICLVTGWVTLSYFLQCVHIVPRTLHKTHKDWYHRLRKSVGIVVNGERQLNLDNTGNQDIFHLNIHKIWDGPGVTSNIAQVFYTYGLYSMSAKPKHLLGLYATEPRKYSHVVKDDRTLQVLRKEDCEDTEAFLSINVEDDTQDSRQLGPEHLPQGAPTPEDTSNTPTTRILTVGVQESIVLVSHLNPVFVIWDYALKMFYRCYMEPALAEELPQEDVRFFIEEIWPVVGHWFVDEPTSYFEDYVFDTSESEQPIDLGTGYSAIVDDNANGYDGVDADSDTENADRPARIVTAKTHQPTTASHKISMPKRPAKTSIRFSFPKASSDSSDASDRSATPCPSGTTNEPGMTLGTPGFAAPKTTRRNLNVDALSNGAQVLESIPEREEWEEAKNGARSPSEGPFQPPDDNPPESTSSDKASRINRYATAISRKAKSIGFTLGKRPSDRTALKGTSFTFKASTVQFGQSAKQDPPGTERTEPPTRYASDTADAGGEPTDGSTSNANLSDPPGASDATAAGPSTAGPSVPQPITRPRRSQPKRNYKEASSSDGFSDAGEDDDDPPPKRLRLKAPAQKGAQKGAPAKKKGRG
ncbi:hypothetical protein FB107DRAFT_286237 [Schizophyllum commune]